jgi:hypothetical protein
LFLAQEIGVPLAIAQEYAGQINALFIEARSPCTIHANTHSSWSADFGFWIRSENASSEFAQLMQDIGNRFLRLRPLLTLTSARSSHSQEWFLLGCEWRWLCYHMAVLRSSSRRSHGAYKKREDTNTAPLTTRSAPRWLPSGGSLYCSYCSLPPLLRLPPALRHASCTRGRFQRGNEHVHPQRVRGMPQRVYTIV